MISIASHRVFVGPNPYAPEAVLVARLDFADGEASPSDQALAAFAACFAGWWKLPERAQNEGADLYHTRLLADWSLAALNEVAGYLHQSGAREEADGQIALWVSYHNAETSFNALRLGIGLLNAFAEGHSDIDQARKSLEGFWQSCRANHPDYQARFLMEAARSRDVPYTVFLPGMYMWQFGWGARALKFFESSPQDDSFAGSRIAKNKTASKNILSRLGAPTPRHLLVKTEAQLGAAAAKVGWPCVVKPIDRGQAKGVTVNVRTPRQLGQAFARARAFSSAAIMVEAMAAGDVHRLLVVRGQLVAASRRSPASVTGDGVQTVLQLAQAFNQARSADDTPGNHAGTVPFDAEFDSTLAEQGLARDSVAEAGQSVRLRTVPLLGTGARNEDVTDRIHPDTRALVESLADTLAIQVAGFDFLTPDIALSCHEAGAFLEINLTPSLRGHMVDGKDVHGVAAAVLGPTPARLPCALIVAPAEATAALAEDFSSVPRLGWRTADSVGIGSVRLKLDADQPVPAFFALTAHKSVERIVFACTPEELARLGMVIDKPDIVLADLEAVEPAWADVLRQQAGVLHPLPDQDAIVSALAPVLEITA